MTFTKKPRKAANQANQLDSGSDDILCYADQGSFIGLRALGRGPILLITWIYQQPLDEAALARFNERLAQGLLGRLLQRSPLPWGRHRWVANRVPAPVARFMDPIPLERLPEWRRDLLDLSVDPEHGPGWRLAVQSLEGGGYALSILVSHTIADGQACIKAVIDALAGKRFELEYPARSFRWAPARLARDSLEFLRSLPSVGHALLALLRRSRSGATIVSHSALGARGNGQNAPEPIVDVPFVTVVLDEKACEERALKLGVASNTLLTAFAARLAFRMGRVDAGGQVKLVLPVSDRQPDDRRGNALRAITVMADPNACLNDLRALQRDLRFKLVSLLRHGDELTPLFPLLPFIPLWLARHLERLALGSDLPVGFSLLGETDPAINRPLGEASQIHMSLLEHYTASTLEQLGGLLYLAGYRIGGFVRFSISGYAPDHFINSTELAPIVRDALADLGLHGAVN